MAEPRPSRAVARRSAPSRCTTPASAVPPWGGSKANAGRAGFLPVAVSFVAAQYRPVLALASS